MAEDAWDVFIAYPGPERATADALHAALTDLGARVFLDHVCVPPGDVWPAAFEPALRAARMTAVLVSRRSERALYQLEEIAIAIALARDDPQRHRVVPVYLDDDADPPYGLRIRQSLAVGADGDIAGVAARLAAVAGLGGDGSHDGGEQDEPLAARPPRPARGSPFRPGTPLYVGDLLPGASRRALVQRICADVQEGRNVNLVGERRMGRTSTLNHVWGQLVAGEQVVARVDLQAGVVDAERFYGAVLAGVERSPLGAGLLDRALLQRVRRAPVAAYDELHAALETLRPHAVPIVLVDELEVCFELPGGFPYPAFYNSLRSLLGGDGHGPLAHAVVATRAPLAEYFARHQMTSTLPSYLPVTRMRRLTAEDAEEALAQDSPQRLGPQQRDHAATLAGGHPCLLQCAGEAWYRALEAGDGGDAAQREFRERAAQACLGVAAGGAAEGPR